MMDREYNRYHRQEENVLAPEDSKLAPELYDEGVPEDVIQRNEMFESYGEFNERPYIEEESSPKTKTGYRKKLLRKMVYTVTAAASVVVMSQTLNMAPVSIPDHGLSEEEKAAIMEEFSNWWEILGEKKPNRETEPDREEGPETDSYLEPATEGDQNVPAGRGVDITQYDGRGYTAAGVMPVSRNGLWGLIDYNGRVLLEPGYPEFVSSPNDQGYTVFASDSRGYIYNAAGQLVYTSPENTEYIVIGEDNIITVVTYHYDTVYEDGASRVFYQTLDGRVLYDSGDMEARDGLTIAASPYFEGRGYVCMYYPGLGMAYLYEVNSGGATLLQSGEPDVTYRPWGALSQGYLLMRSPQYSGSYALYQASTGAISYAVQTAISGSVLEKNGLATASSLTWEYNSYKDNGAYLYNYGAYAVISAYDTQSGTYRKDFLVDMTKVSYSNDRYGGYFDEAGVIAVCDGINLDDFRYLAAMDQGRCFYIDYAGNVVSDFYDSATSFTDGGYAMVQVGTRAYVINDNFEYLRSFENVETVGYCGECFTVYYLDGTVDLVSYAGE